MKDTETQQIFIDFLASKKLRLTSQRKIIFDEITLRSGHAEIEKLYAAVKKIDQKIGLATIYRTTKLLTESGLVREVRSGGGKLFYEAVVGRPHHDHLTCSECGENIEFIDANMERLQKEIAKKYGYELTGHALYLNGICPNCKKMKRKNII